MMTPMKQEGFTFMVCDDCGISERVHSENFVEKNEEEELGEGVIRNENLFATYEHKCSKCGYDKAEVIDMGIFISDEDNLILIRCGKCGHTDRLGRKTS